MLKLFFGLKLLEYQKVILRAMYEQYKNKKDVRIVMHPYFCQEYFYVYLKQNSLPVRKELAQK